MTGTAPQVITIQPTRGQAQAVRRQLRVAAYCRVSTDDEEQLTSYEAQPSSPSGEPSPSPDTSNNGTLIASSVPE